MNDRLFQVGDCLLAATELWRVRKAAGFTDLPLLFQDQAWLETKAAEADAMGRKIVDRLRESLLFG